MSGLSLNGVSGFISLLQSMDVDRTAEKNVEAAAQQLESEIKSRTPVDTGHLRASITHQTSGKTARVWTDVEYASYQEYGTYKMGAQPYFRPGIEASRQQVLQTMAGKTLEEAFSN